MSLKYTLVGIALAVVLAVTVVAVYVSAHEERQTLVAAERAREFGVVTYRLVRIGGGMRPDARQLPRTQVRAELLGPGGIRVGRFTLSLTWRKEFDDIAKKTKPILVTKRYHLQWLDDVLVSEMDIQRQTYSLEHNGVLIYAGPFVGSEDHVRSFVETNVQLLSLIASVERDLKMALPHVQDEVQCCAQVGCNGQDRYGQGSAWLQNDACAEAIQSANNRCSNQYCWGCCAMNPGGCNCVCAAAPFLCLCEIDGTMCGCEVYQQ